MPHRNVDKTPKATGNVFNNLNLRNKKMKYEYSVDIGEPKVPPIKFDESLLKNIHYNSKWNEYIRPENDTKEMVNPDSDFK